MIALILVAVITVGSVAFFYMKTPLLKSVAMLFGAIIGVLVAFNYYELLAYQLISRGHLGQLAHPLCLILLFAIAFALIRLGTDQIISADIDFGKLLKAIVSITCGLTVGLIISGVVLVALAMTPLSPSLPYERFAAGKLDADRVSPSKSVVADGFVSGLFNLASKGSFSSKKSFDVYHADFLDQLHLNRSKLGDPKTGVPMITGGKALIVPSKNNVRTKEGYAIVRAGIKSGLIQRGGSSLAGSAVMFTPGQLRLLCKEKAEVGNTSGSAAAVYPVECKLLNGPFKEGDDEDANVDLAGVVTVESKDFVSKKGGRAAWMDIYFKVPSGHQAMFLQFRNNEIAKLGKPVPETEEILQYLDQ